MSGGEGSARGTPRGSLSRIRLTWNAGSGVAKVSLLYRRGGPTLLERSPTPWPPFSQVPALLSRKRMRSSGA